jgi:lysine decarboxylase
MKLSRGVLADAEARAARLWDAHTCRFSVGGSTHGNQALALAVARPGDSVIVSRTLHRSLLLGFVLAGLVPVWVRPEVDPDDGLPRGVPVAGVEAALAAHPEVRAVFVGDPSYVGTLSDVHALAEVAHGHGIPVVVDAAWGAHFGFHDALPAHALALGADALVTSAHKMLPAYSQAALVLARTDRIDRDRLDRAFEATHTTSPAGAILASVDAARALLERDGERILGRLVETVAAARRRLGAIDGLRILSGPGVDPTKLVLGLAGTGADGVAVERDLIAAGMPVEMADRDTIAAIVTMADPRATVDAFVDAVAASIDRRRGPARGAAVGAAWAVEPVMVLPPRDAFFASPERVDIAAAIGRVSAELVAPYPPGIPVLAPGELVTEDAIAALLAALDGGVRIAYAADPTLRTLQVVR